MVSHQLIDFLFTILIIAWNYFQIRQEFCLPADDKFFSIYSKPSSTLTLLWMKILTFINRLFVFVVNPKFFVSRSPFTDCSQLCSSFRYWFIACLCGMFLLLEFWCRCLKYKMWKKECHKDDERISWFELKIFLLSMKENIFKKIWRKFFFFYHFFFF